MGHRRLTRIHFGNGLAIVLGMQERKGGEHGSDGRADRTIEEIQEWAREHDLPYFDDQVHFPDVRIEYQDVNGDIRWEDVEVTTEHYRGGHASAAARSGFSIHTSGSSRTGGSFCRTGKELTNISYRLFVQAAFVSGLFGLSC